MGRACALYLATRNVRVFAGVRDPAHGEALLNGGSANLVPVELDVTSPSSIASAIDQCTHELGGGGLDALVNNAGIPSGGPLEFVPIDDVRHVLDVNVLGTLSVIQHSLPSLRLATGRIINISSVSGFLATPFLGPYAASKHALEALSNSLRVELRPWGIPVSIIQPGRTKTEIWNRIHDIVATARAAQTDSENPDYRPILKHLEAPKGDGMEPNHVAHTVYKALFAKRPRARYRVGADAKIMYRLSRLPTTAIDRILANRLPPYGE